VFEADPAEPVGRVPVIAPGQKVSDGAIMVGRVHTVYSDSTSEASSTSLLLLASLNLFLIGPLTAIVAAMSAENKASLMVNFIVLFGIESNFIIYWYSMVFIEI